MQISWQAQYKMRRGEIAKARNAVAPKLASQGLRNDGCETVSGHARIILGHGRNRPSIGIRVFTCFLKCRFRGRHSTL